MKTYNQLKEMFLASNQAFIRDDKDLLDSQVSERSLCGALMLHLNRLMLRSEDFEGYYTDVEYNRNRGNIKTIKKTIRGQEEQMPEICKYLGISRDTALRWIATKNMPAPKIGKNWKFKVSEIDEWVNKGQAEE